MKQSLSDFGKIKSDVLVSEGVCLHGGRLHEEEGELARGIEGDGDFLILRKHKREVVIDVRLHFLEDLVLRVQSEGLRSLAQIDPQIIEDYFQAPRFLYTRH